MKDYAFLEPAQIELEEEVKYYNEQQPGLGYDFAKENRGIGAIESNRFKSSANLALQTDR